MISLVGEAAVSLSLVFPVYRAHAEAGGPLLELLLFPGYEVKRVRAGLKGPGGGVRRSWGCEPGPRLSPPTPLSQSRPPRPGAVRCGRVPRPGAVSAAGPEKRGAVSRGGARYPPLVLLVDPSGLRDRCGSVHSKLVFLFSTNALKS